MRHLGVTGRVKSPTFELVSDYDVLDGIAFHHFDFYRFESPIEFDEAGFRDLFGPGSITASEWSDKAGEFLPSADLELVIAICGTERDVTLKAYSMDTACSRNLKNDNIPATFCLRHSGCRS